MRRDGGLMPRRGCGGGRGAAGGGGGRGGGCSGTGGCGCGWLCFERRRLRGGGEVSASRLRSSRDRRSLRLFFPLRPMAASAASARRGRPEACSEGVRTQWGPDQLNAERPRLQRGQEWVVDLRRRRCPASRMTGRQRCGRSLCFEAPPPPSAAQRGRSPQRVRTERTPRARAAQRGWRRRRRGGRLRPAASVGWRPAP